MPAPANGVLAATAPALACAGDLRISKRHGWLSVIMGRKTADSLPPLPAAARAHPTSVVTRQSGWQAGGAVVAHSLQGRTGLRRAGAAKAASEVWVIGGAELYRLALSAARRAVVTELALTWTATATHRSSGGLARDVSRTADQRERRGAFVTYERPSGTA